MPTARERWFAEVLQAGLDTRVLSHQDILAHATPAVLSGALPRDVMAKVFEATLASGTMSHRAIVEVVTLGLLAEKVPPTIVWGAIAAAGDRGGIRDGAPKDEVGVREFVRRMLASALDTGVLVPKDVIAQANPHVLATSLPEALTTKLLEATLAGGKMNPEIIVATIGVDHLAKHISTKVLWAAFVKPGEAPASASDKHGTIASAPAPKLEVIDDEVNNVLVELEGLEPEAKPEVKAEAKPAPVAAATPIPAPAPAADKGKPAAAAATVPAKQPARP